MLEEGRDPKTTKRNLIGHRTRQNNCCFRGIKPEQTIAFLTAFELGKDQPSKTTAFEQLHFPKAKQLHFLKTQQLQLHCASLDIRI